MDTLAVVLKGPEDLRLGRVDLEAPGVGDVIVDVRWSGISTGTERLLYSGTMPPFPGMGYPLVPGYESVGEVVSAQAGAGLKSGELVFVPGARCFKDVHALFGGAAARLVVPSNRVVPVPATLGENSVLLALAATAYHAIDCNKPPELVVGHGVLGRLIARITIALGHAPPTVWERASARQQGARGYQVIAPDADDEKGYNAICDVSGDAGILDSLISRLAPAGEITLAGFYSDRVSFAFPRAFMCEARIRVAAQWQPADLRAVTDLICSGALALDGLITHRKPAKLAEDAYRKAFADPECLKMVLDWRDETP